MRFLTKLRRRYPTAWLVLRLLLPVAVTVVVLMLLASGAVFYAVVTPARSLEVIDPSHYHLYAMEVTWDGVGGEVHQGWYIRGSNGAPLIVLCHGFNTNRTEVLSLAARLRDLGYNTFLFNFRGHGLSPYRMSSLGLLEAQDLKAGIQKLLPRPEIDFRRIGIFGVSQGAYAALEASRDDPNVQVLILDSTYRSLDSFIALRVERIVGLRTELMSRLVSWVYCLYFRVSPGRVSQEFQAEDFARKSLLFITGRDRESSGLAKDTRYMYTTAKGRKEIFTLNTSRESLLYGEDRQRYDLFVIDFFRQELPLVAPDPDFDSGPPAQ